MPLPQYSRIKIYRPKRKPTTHRRRPSKDGRRTALKRWNDNSSLPNRMMRRCVNAMSVENIVNRRRSNAKKMSGVKHKLSKLAKTKSKYYRRRSRPNKTHATRMVLQPEPQPEPESELQNLSSFEFHSTWSTSTFQPDFEHKSSIDPSVRPKCRMRSIPKKTKEVKRPARKKIPTMKAGSCKRANPRSPSRKTTKATKKVVKKNKTGKPSATRIEEICSGASRRPWWRFWSRDDGNQIPDAEHQSITRKTKTSPKKDRGDSSHEFIIPDGSIIDLTEEPVSSGAQSNPFRVPQGRVNKRIQVPSEP